MVRAPVPRPREALMPSLRETPITNEEVTVVSSPLPPAPTSAQSLTPLAQTPEPSLVVEPRHSSPSTRADPLRSDKTPHKD